MSLMKDIVFMFELHQPYRLYENLEFEVIKNALRGNFRSLKESLFDNNRNKEIFNRATKKCYINATKIILGVSHKLAKKGKQVKFSFSLSGLFFEQANRWNKEVLELIKEGVNNEFIELVDQTYYHSLASLFPEKDELMEQIKMHRGILRDYFNKDSCVVENTEFIYNNDLACLFKKIGYKVILTEGVDWILGWRSPDYVYKAWKCNIRVLLRNYRLSDDIGFRFSNIKWDQFPLTADKYISWLNATPGDVIFLAMDYETFGEHQWPSTGIYEFLRNLPIEVYKYTNLLLEFPSKAAYKHVVRDEYDVPPWSTISWADERDLSAWLGNEFQKRAFNIYLSLEPYVKAIGGELLKVWRKLGASDYYYYIATKGGTAGEVHNYFSPHKSIVIAFETYVKALMLLSKEVADEISNNPKRYAVRIKLPLSKAFYFYIGNKYTGYHARSIKELLKIMRKVSSESLIYHLKRKDLQFWIKSQFYLNDLAQMLDDISKSYDIDNIRQRALELVKSFIDSA